jgi:hypothetical protein
VFDINGLFVGKVKKGKLIVLTGKLTGGFLLIWPAMGLDARFSAPWFHPVYTPHTPQSSPDRLGSASLPRKSKHGHTSASRARRDCSQTFSASKR